MREEEIRSREKRKWFHLNLIKIASLIQAHFQGFVWCYTVTIKNKFCLVCRIACVPDCSENKLFSNYQKKPIEM